MWTEQFGTAASDGARSVAVDPTDGSPVVAGYTGGSLEGESSSGGRDAFLRKHSSSGESQWTRQFGSSLRDDALDVAVDQRGNTYVAGVGDPLQRGRTGAYIAKYLPDGSLATRKNASGNERPWVKQFGGGRIQTFALDPEGNPFIAVNINGDVYVYKLNPAGVFEESQPFGAYCNLLDISFGSAVGRGGDPSVYVTGITSGQIDDAGRRCNWNPGITDSTDQLFLIKFDGNLNKKWHKQFGSYGGSSFAMGVAVDSNDDAYVVGNTTGVVRGANPTSSSETNEGGRDHFIVKVGEYFDVVSRKHKGRIEWARQFGTPGNEFARDITIDAEDNLYVAGNTTGSFDEAKPNAGGTDAFVGKYDAKGEELVVRQFGAGGNDSAQGIAHDALTKSVLVTGNTNGSFDGAANAGGADGFLFKVRDENLNAGPPPGAEPKTPLIFVPGAAGTELLYGPEDDIVDPNTGSLVPMEKWIDLPKLLLPLDPFLLDLRLAPNGEDPFGPETKYETRVGDIVRMGESDLLDVDPVAELEAAGYEEGKDLFPFPYDWRKDTETTKGGGYLYFDGDTSKDMTLVEFIDYVQRETGAEQVDVMAHSLGGLVTLSAMRDPAVKNPDGTGKVRKVLTLGTPVLGATKFYGFLQYRLGCFIEIPDLACISNPANLQKTIENFPALYQGIPGRNFHAAEGSPLVFDYDSDGDGARDGEKSYEYWTGLDGRPADGDNVAKSHNEALMRAGDEYHERYDDLAAAPFAAPLEYTRIVGDSRATPESFHKKLSKPNCSPDREYSEIPCTYKDYEYEIIESGIDRFEGGDGTIPLHSADVYNPSRGFDMTFDHPNVYAHNVEHGTLATDESVLGFAVTYFADERQASSRNAQASSPMSFFAMREANAQGTPQDTEEVARIAEQSGLSMTPESFGGIEVFTSGPVRGYLEDGAGEKLGDAEERPGESIAQEIPGGDYNRIADSQSFFLNDANGSYQANFEAVGGEEIEVKVRNFVSGKITEQAIYRLESPAGSDLKLGFSTDAEVGAGELLVDTDSDGTVDRRVPPVSVVKGPAASEYDAPTTTLDSKVVESSTPRGPRDDGTDGGRGRPRPEEALVTLSADDGPDGSGVATTYYALPGDTELRVYESPFRVPLGTVVRFGSTDKADNVEVQRSVRVDDTPSGRNGAEPISAGDNLRRYIEHDGDEDWFVFEADGTSTYRLHLHGLPTDYDLTLHDGSGNEIASSTERGRRSEEVRQKLTTGRYYVQVSGFEGAWDNDKPYSLDFDTLGSGTGRENR